MPSLLATATRLIAASVAVVLGGCATTDLHTAATSEVEALKVGPRAAPYRTITGFSDALRCMDNLMIVHGVRDWPVLVEDLTDHTKKINAGTKDMLISAVSDLSKRSRAIRLVTFGTDSGNLANFHANAESKRPYETLPLYDIRGSISQLDEGLFKKQIEGGITFGPVGVGAAKSGDASILALDLSVISARDYSVIPGVTARNSVMIYKEGKGVDGEAEYKKLGLNFGMTLTRSEGKAQALRGLVELAVVELAGKLTHTPYWSCLGADPASEAVAGEIADWFYTMTVHGEIVGWAQTQLAVRGLYRGEVDGEPNPAFDAALANYRARLGLSAEPVLDEAFFAAYLRANHKEISYAAVRPKKAVEPPAAEAATAPASKSAADSKLPAANAPVAANTAAAASKATPASSPANTAAPAAKNASASSATTTATANTESHATASASTEPAPLKLAITAGAAPIKAGASVELTIKPSRDAHVICYLIEDQGVQRFYPNRFSTATLVRAASPLALPGDMRFRLIAPAKGQRESVACFATARNVLGELAPTVVGRDFERLPVTSLRELRDAYLNTVGNKFAQEVFHVEAH